MKAIITAILLFSLSGAFAQDEAAEKQFRIDLEDNSLKLYILGGIAPKYYKSDTIFHTVYRITLRDFGCTAPINLSYYQDYNILVFEHLKEKWGRRWEEATERKNFMGWEKWKEKK